MTCYDDMGVADILEGYRGSVCSVTPVLSNLCKVLQVLSCCVADTPHSSCGRKGDGSCPKGPHTEWTQQLLPQSAVLSHRQLQQQLYLLCCCCFKMHKLSDALHRCFPPLPPAAMQLRKRFWT
eukprot:GHUV01009367.1.p1 GENE.GHUV01009367.1~~GHUV01009367.1.p1  ORF type:complete len:123 (-),score=22.95 GHUV01009367.1:733-1101(-)